MEFKKPLPPKLKDKSKVNLQALGRGRNSDVLKIVGAFSGTRPATKRVLNFTPPFPAKDSNFSKPQPQYTAAPSSLPGLEKAIGDGRENMYPAPKRFVFLLSNYVIDVFVRSVQKFREINFFRKEVLM